MQAVPVSAESGSKILLSESTTLQTHSYNDSDRRPFASNVEESYSDDGFLPNCTGINLTIVTHPNHSRNTAQLEEEVGVAVELVAASAIIMIMAVRVRSSPNLAANSAVQTRPGNSPMTSALGTYVVPALEAIVKAATELPEAASPADASVAGSSSLFAVDASAVGRLLTQQQCPGNSSRECSQKGTTIWMVVAAAMLKLIEVRSFDVELSMTTFRLRRNFASVLACFLCHHPVVFTSSQVTIGAAVTNQLLRDATAINVARATQSTMCSATEAATAFAKRTDAAGIDAAADVAGDVALVREATTHIETIKNSQQEAMFPTEVEIEATHLAAQFSLYTEAIAVTTMVPGISLCFYDGLPVVSLPGIRGGLSYISPDALHRLFDWSLPSLDQSFDAGGTHWRGVGPTELAVAVFSLKSILSLDAIHRGV